MDALYSGQAGVIALLEGAEARVQRVGNADAEFTISREGVTYLFGRCTDVVRVQGADERSVKRSFEEAWNADRALRMLLIALDPEEEIELRNDAADCLEELLVRDSARVFVENEFYARTLPADTDFSALQAPQRKLVLSLLAGIIDNQAAIRERRASWDELPSSLFEDNDKRGFEEQAIRRGAFRMLASVDSNSVDRNIAILNCYTALASVPNSRIVVNEWTKRFRRPGLKLVIEEEVDTPEAAYDSYTEFTHSNSQRDAIGEKLRRGELNLARKYADQLVRRQLQKGGAEFAAKSLCDLAQRAKNLHLHSLQLEWAQRAVDTSPSDAWAHGQAADALMQYSRLNEALEELEIAERLGDVEFAATARARILRHQGELDEALVSFRAARDKYQGQENESYTWFGAAETLRDMSKLEAALREYDQGLAKFPDAPMLRCGRASVLADLGRLNDALASYSSPKLRNDLVALNGRASVLRDQGKLAEALDAIAISIELYPADPIARCIQAEILRLKGDYQGALQLYQYIKDQHPTIPAAYGGYAEVLRDIRKYPEAVEAYKSASERFPYDVRIANGYANIRKVNGELPESLRLYEQNVRRFPYNLVSKAGRADLLKRLGNYDDAVAAYDDILLTWPGNESARNGKAAVLVVKGLYDEAAMLLPLGDPSSRNEWIAWHIRGMILLRTNKIDEAVRFFEEATNRIPFAWERRLFSRALSIAKLRQGKFEPVIQALAGDGGELSNVLRFHAYAGAKRVGRAHVLYRKLVRSGPSPLSELRDAIAMRYDLAQGAVAQNDNWIFARESEALLQEAA